MLVAHQLLRAAKFFHFSKAQHQNLVALYDGVQPVRYREHRRVGERALDESLYLLFGDHVDVGGRFVEDDDARLPKDSPTDADELSFARAEVLAVLRYWLEESFWIGV